MNPVQNAAEIETRPCSQCPACYETGEVLYQGLEDMLYAASGSWTLKKCIRPKCGLIWLDPQPTPASLPEAYRNYYTHVGSAFGQLGNRKYARRIYNSIRNGFLNVKMGYASSRLDAIMSPLAVLHPCGLDAFRVEAMFLSASRNRGRLLELGCGSGHLLKQMRHLGWEVEGLEFDPVCIEAVRKENIKCHEGDLREQHLPSGQFDAIYAGNVLEHVYDPAGLLRECLRLLSTGGRLIVITPNSEGFGHRFYGRDWRGLEPPRHLQIFNCRNLGSLGKACGFTDCRVRSSARGAWYILGCSHAIRRAQFTGNPKLKKMRLLSVSNLLRQILERMLMMFSSRLGEEVIFIGIKR